MVGAGWTNSAAAPLSSTRTSPAGAGGELAPVQMRPRASPAAPRGSAARTRRSSSPTAWPSLAAGRGAGVVQAASSPQERAPAAGKATGPPARPAAPAARSSAAGSAPDAAQPHPAPARRLRCCRCSWPPGGVRCAVRAGVPGCSWRFFSAPPPSGTPRNTGKHARCSRLFPRGNTAEHQEHRKTSSAEKTAAQAARNGTTLAPWRSPSR